MSTLARKLYRLAVVAAASGLALVAAFPFADDAVPLEDGGVYRVLLDADAVDRDWLSAEGFDIAGHDLAAGRVEVLVDGRGLERLRERGLALRIVERRSGGLTRAASETTEAQPNPLLDTDYADPDEVYAFLLQVTTDHPSITRLEAIGASVEGRTIWALMISDNAASDEDELGVIFNAAHHGREVMTPEVVMDTIDQLTDSYGSDPQITALVDAYQIWCVPMVNPDGVNLVFTEDRWWRKNASDNDDNGRITWKDGVDVNRNYEWGWGGQCQGSSPGSSQATFRGPAEASEPEARAMIELGRRVQPVFYVEYHSYGEDVFYALGCDPSLSPRLSTVQGPDQSIARVIGEEYAAQIVQADGGLGFVASAFGSRVDGIGRDHHAHDSGAVAFVTEVNHLDEGGFQPDFGTWRDPTVAGQRPGWLWLLERIAGAAVGGVVLDAVTGEPVAADISLDEMTLPDDRRLTARSDSGRFHVIVVPGSYTLRVRAPGYVEEVITVGVGDSWLPLTVTLQPDASTRLAYEDFDDPAAIAGWSTSDPGDSATGGLWEWGDPHSTHAGDLINMNLVRGAPGLDRTPGGGYGAFLTGNASGGDLEDDDVDDGSTTLTTPAFDLSGHYAVEAAWQHWLYTEPEDPTDGLEVEVSTDGGTSWLHLGNWLQTTSGPEATQAWNAVRVGLDEVVVPGPDVRLRFRMTDGGADNVVEAAIDEFEIRGYDLAGPGVVAGVRFHGAAGFVVEWNPVPGASNAVYEIVRGDVASLSLGAGSVALGGLTCIDAAAPGSSVPLGAGEVPPPGAAWFYLVRFKLGFSEGGWGTSSDGSARIGVGCSP